MAVATIREWKVFKIIANGTTTLRKANPRPGVLDISNAEDAG
jgi:hypothetical protein